MIRREESIPYSPIRENWPIRFPEGPEFARIPLEASKAYPIKIWDGLDVIPRIAYADLNTHNDQNNLVIKYLNKGGKTAPHPQIAFFVFGSYHVEKLGYFSKDPNDWKSWIELILDARQLNGLIEGLMKLQLYKQGIKT